MSQYEAYELKHADFAQEQAGKLIDPETGTTSVKQVIIVEGRRIKAIGQNLPIPTGAEAISFIESYIEAGVPPKTTLQALTVNAARLLGVEKDRGAIKPGMYADIIATPENPLDNIRTLQQVSFVMKDGNIFKKTP